MKEELGGGLEKGMPHRGQSGAKVLSAREQEKTGVGRAGELEEAGR